jgi:hypothetical protein
MIFGLNHTSPCVSNFDRVLSNVTKGKL